jgi:AraC-like DNA-binding protein
MCSLYIEESLFPDGFHRCEVVAVSDLLRSLLMAAPGIAAEYDPDGRDGALVNLLLHELRELSPVPLSLPFPQHLRLVQKCQNFLERPSSHDTIDNWCNDLGMTRRTFTRLFKRETGCTFVEWRQKACLMSALPQLADGNSVTSIALDLGYEIRLRSHRCSSGFWVPRQQTTAHNDRIESAVFSGRHLYDELSQWNALWAGHAVTIHSFEWFRDEASRPETAAMLTIGLELIAHA